MRFGSGLLVSSDAAACRPLGGVIAGGSARPETLGQLLAWVEYSASVYDNACLLYTSTVAITVTPSDAGRVTSTAVTWSGAGKSGTATKTGSTWTVGPLYSTHSGTATLTVTATITDRAGAARTASTTVAFRQISEECIG